MEGGNSYCSAVCCTYTQKQVILTKDHDSEAACTIFHNDIRSYGKDFERFYQRAEKLPGIRFIRSYTSIVKEDPETKNVTVRYSTTDEGRERRRIRHGRALCRVEPSRDAKELAKKFGIELNAHGFCKLNPFNPMETNRPGIFVSGAFQGPIDIPESVVSGCGAGAQMGELLDYRRGNLSKERVYPEERDVSQEEPRIGVYRLPLRRQHRQDRQRSLYGRIRPSLPNVVHAEESLFICATEPAASSQRI